MTVIEFLDAVDTLAKALAVWFVIGAAIATPVVLVVGWAVTRFVKWAWRLFRPHVPVAGARRPQGRLRGAPAAPTSPTVLLKPSAPAQTIPDTRKPHDRP